MVPDGGSITRVVCARCRGRTCNCTAPSLVYATGSNYCEPWTLSGASAGLPPVVTGVPFPTPNVFGAGAPAPPSPRVKRAPSTLRDFSRALAWFARATRRT